MNKLTYFFTITTTPVAQLVSARYLYDSTKYLSNAGVVSSNLTWSILFCMESILKQHNLRNKQMLRKAYV